MPQIVAFVKYSCYCLLIGNTHNKNFLKALSLSGLKATPG